MLAEKCNTTNIVPSAEKIGIHAAYTVKSMQRHTNLYIWPCLLTPYRPSISCNCTNSCGTSNERRGNKGKGTGKGTEVEVEEECVCDSRNVARSKI